MLNENQSVYKEITNSYDFNVLEYDDVFLNNTSLQKDAVTGQIDVVVDQLQIEPRHINNQNDDPIEQNFLTLIKYQNGFRDHNDEYGHHCTDYYNKFSKLTPEYINELYNDYEETDEILEGMVLYKLNGVIKFEVLSTTSMEDVIDYLQLYYYDIVYIDQEITNIYNNFVTAESLYDQLLLKADLEYLLDNYYEKTDLYKKIEIDAILTNYKTDAENELIYYTIANQQIDMAAYAAYQLAYLQANYYTQNVSLNTFVSKGQLSPYLTGTILTNKFNLYVLITDISNYNTNAKIDTKFGLYILKTSLTYNTDALLNAISSLTNYYTKTASDAKYELISNMGLYILKTSLTYNTDALLNAISSLTNYYDKTTSDSRYLNSGTTNLLYYYLKTEVDTLLNNKVNTSSFVTYYNDAQLTNAFNLYALVSSVYDKTTSDARYLNSGTTNLLYYYLKTEVDTLLTGYILKTSLTYNTDSLLNNISSLVNYYTKTQVDTISTNDRAYTDAEITARAYTAPFKFSYSGLSLADISATHINTDYYLPEEGSTYVIIKKNLFYAESTNGASGPYNMIFCSEATGNNYFENTNNNFYNAGSHTFSDYPTVTNSYTEITTSGSSFQQGIWQYFGSASKFMKLQGSDNGYYVLDMNTTNFSTGFAFYLRCNGTNKSEFSVSTSLWTVSSTIKLKKNIKEYDCEYQQSNLEEFLSIDFIKFEYNDDISNDQSSFGIKAEDLYEKLPYFDNCINVDKTDDKENLLFNPTLFLLKSVAVLQEELKNQVTKNQEYEERLSKLEEFMESEELNILNY